jgi:hypothetical protein
MAKKTHDVFGVSNTVLRDSYVDRGSLDSELQTLLARPIHVAIRGESKCGKSWLRQQAIPNPLTVQCRLEKTVEELYVDALSQLGVRLSLERSADRKLRGRVEAEGSAGVSLLGKIGLRTSAEGERAEAEKTKAVGHDVSDLRFVADIIKASGRRLVVEDFHYLSWEERRRFAFDLKALWDYGLFVVVIGVWSQSNMLLYFNPDLSGRVHELSIYWTEADLERVLRKGGDALYLDFTEQVRRKMVKSCFGNVGILQSLALGTLDVLGIREAETSKRVIADLEALGSATLTYADQLNPLYQQFAARVARGIRTRQDSTGIYAHAMAAILEASDEALTRGLSIDRIFDIAHARQPRIHKGNLKTVLEKFEELQIDDAGRGLVLSYNEATNEVTVVDRQILLYRAYRTISWPWEELIKESGEPIQRELPENTDE